MNYVGISLPDKKRIKKERDLNCIMTWKRAQKNGKNTSASKNAQPSSTEKSMIEPPIRRARSHNIMIGEKSYIYILA